MERQKETHRETGIQSERHTGAIQKYIRKIRSAEIKAATETNAEK